MKTQQTECYAAEGHLGSGHRFATVGDAQSFVDALRDRPWWTSQGYHLRVARIEVGATGPGKKRSVGWYDKDKGAGRIELTRDGLCERVVLHEVAHVLASAQYGSKSHDPWWARTYLTLVSCVMGVAPYTTLRNAFDAQGVDYDVDTATRPGVIAL